MEGIWVTDEDAAYNLHKKGKCFEGPPSFEFFKNIYRLPNIGVSPADGNLVKEVKFQAEHKKNHPVGQPPNGQFAPEPYDNYRELLNKLIERIPDFNMHLKVNPKTNRIELLVDVSSIFDIAQFTLSRMISEDPASENIGQSDDRSKGIMICCWHCGNPLNQEEIEDRNIVINPTIKKLEMLKTNVNLGSENV